MELGSRLECALSFVRVDSKIYDIGSDHGYLPCELICRGICKNAVVTDVNKGPLERAEKTFLEREIYGSAEFFLTDGLMGLRFDSFPSDVTICGMGGELIASILDARRDVWENDINFILQPMTKADELRRYLWDNGFEILSEKAVTDTDKTYVVINAVHRGEKVSYDEWELYLGKRESVAVSPETAVLFAKTVSGFEKKRDGLKISGKDVSKLEKFILKIKAEAKLYGVEI